MERYTAVTRFVRISPRKARLAAGLIRGLPAEAAEHQLRFSRLKAGRLLIKTLRSAMASAESLRRVPGAKSLMVEEVRVDEGPRLKRSKPRSRGSQHPILKRMSHFTVVVAAS